MIKDQYVLFYNKSKTILVDVDNARPVEIPIGADMLHYESPIYVALDGTTFTMYDIHDKTLEPHILGLHACCSK